MTTPKTETETGFTSSIPTTHSKRDSKLIELLERFGLFGLLGLVFLFFAVNPVTSRIFLSEPNILAMIRNPMVLILIALASLIPLAVGVFDLSVAAVAGLSSVVAASAMADFNLPAPLAIFLGILSGLVFGSAQGWIMARFQLSSIIVTLASTTFLAGVLSAYTGGLTIAAGLPTWLLDFGSSNWLRLPAPVFIILPIVLLLWYLQDFTVWGRKADAIRSNPKSADLVGIRLDRGKWVATTLSGLVAGIAGVMMVAISGGTDAGAGPGYLLPALAAVFLGATTIKPGVPNVWGAVIGVFFVQVSVSGLILMGMDSWVTDVFNGTVLFLAAVMSTYFARKRGGGGPALV